MKIKISLPESLNNQQKLKKQQQDLRNGRVSLRNQ